MVSVHDYGPAAFGPVAGSAAWQMLSSRVAHFVTAQEGRERLGGAECLNLLQGHATNDLTAFPWPRLPVMSLAEAQVFDTQAIGDFRPRT